MSGEGGWSLTLACNRADAETFPDIGDVFADLADPPSLNVEEPDPDRPDEWLMTAYCNDRPDADWTTLSQRNLDPVRAGRFLVHTRAHADAVRPGDIAITIEAGLAFGTGQHATTHGCLLALDRLGKRRRFANIADLGTGTGVLALAAARRWKAARTIASDIDPVSIAVTRANLRDNKISAGHSAGRIELVVAAGLHHRRLAARAPFDLIVANILAPPLVAMSRPVSAALALGGILVLAGLLRSQAMRVRAAYRRHGLVPLAPQRRRGEWPCVVLIRRSKT